MPKSLHEVTAQGDTQALIGLLEQGAYVNARDDEGETPLHYAVRSKQDEVVRLLLQYGADIHARGNNDGSVLQSAAWLGSVKTMQLLLDHGAAADPHDAQQALRNCFFDNGHIKAPLLIAAGAKMGMVEAIYFGDLELVRRILNEGANADDIGEKYTPLMHVLSSNNFDKISMVDSFLAAGADINRISPDDNTALLVSFHWCDSDLVAELIHRGADVNLAVKTGETPIMYAIRYYPQLVAILIKKGANVNVRDKTGKTPLMLAREEERPDLIEELIRAGANE